MFTNSYQWFWFTQTPKSNSHAGFVCPFMSVVLISLKHWRATHLLDVYSPIFISGSDLPKHWRALATHFLDASVHPFLSVVLIYSSTEEKLTCWTRVNTFSSVVLICSNTGEQLTRWMHVHPFLSVVWSAQTLESNSHPKCTFAHSCQWFQSTHSYTWLTAWMQPFLLVVLIRLTPEDQLTS